MVDESIVTAARTYLRALAEGGLAVRFGVIFGSWAVGAAHEWSDIDLLVVSLGFDGACDRRDVDFLWRTTVHTDNRIEPIPCGEKQWQEDDSSAIVELARRQGQLVNVEGQD